MFKIITVFFILHYSLFIAGQTITHSTDSVNDTLVAKEYLIDTIYINPDTIYYTDTIYKNAEGIYQFDKNKPEIAIQIFNGINKSILNYNSESEFSWKTDLLNEKSESILSYKAGSRIMLNYRNYNFSIGLIFWGIREKMSLEPTDQLIDINMHFETELLDSFSIIIGEDTSWTSVYREIQVNDTNYLTINNPYYNKYHYIGIPVNFGYIQNNGKLKIKYMLGGGIYFYMKNKKNQLISIENQGLLVKIDKDKELRKILISLDALIELEYRFFYQTGLFVNFGFHNLTSNIFRNSFGLTLKPTTWSIGFGLNYYFNLKNTH